MRLVTRAAVLLALVCLAAGTANYEQEVKTAVLRGYDRTSRPFPLFPDQPVVTHMMLMLRSFEISEYYMTARINAWVVMVWSDPRLTWQPSDHGDTYLISVGSNQIWIPDIMLMNGVSHLEPTFLHVPTLVDDAGTVTFVGPASFRVRCRKELASWPYDEQKCTIILSSWTNEADHHQVEPAGLTPGEELVTAKDLIATDSHWKVVKTEGYMVNKTYKCCQGSIWHELNVDLHVKRVSILYAVCFIAPCLAFSVQILAVFWIPPASSAKIKTASIHTAALAFFLLNLFWWMPPYGGGSVPRIVSFVTCSLVMSAVSMVTAVVSTNLSTRLVEPPAALLSALAGIASVPLRLGDLNEKLQSRRAPFAEDGVPAQDKQAQETVRRAEWAVLAAGLDRSVCLLQLVLFILMSLACLT